MAKNKVKKRKLIKKSDGKPTATATPASKIDKKLKKKKKPARTPKSKVLSNKQQPSSDSDSEPTSDKIRELLEPYTKEQLISLAVDAALSHPSLLSLIHSAADTDICHRKIFVHNLGWDTTRQTLLSAFEPYGEIEECNVVTDRVTGKAKGYAFVVFKNRKAALKALKEPKKKIGSRIVSYQLATLGHVGSTPSGTQDVSSRKIYVANVPRDIDSEKLRNFFGKFGEIESGPNGFDPQTGKSKGYALFVYKTGEGARKCLEEPYKTFDGIVLSCRKATEGKNVSKTGGGTAGITTAVVSQPLQSPGMFAAMAAAQKLALGGQHPGAGLLNPMYSGMIGTGNAGYVNPFMGMGTMGQPVMGATQAGQLGAASAFSGYGAAMGTPGYGSLGTDTSLLGAYAGGAVCTSSGQMLQGLQHVYSNSESGRTLASKLSGMGAGAGTGA